MGNSSRGRDPKRKLSSAGGRTGKGAESVVPYLHDELASKPQELLPADPFSESNAANNSFVGRVRKALRIITRKRRGPR
jgi:hypothetical protein